MNRSQNRPASTATATSALGQPRGSRWRRSVRGQRWRRIAHRHAPGVGPFPLDTHLHGLESQHVGITKRCHGKGIMHRCPGEAIAFLEPVAEEVKEIGDHMPVRLPRDLRQCRRSGVASTWRVTLSPTMRIGTPLVKTMSAASGSAWMLYSATGVALPWPVDPP